MGWNNCSKWIWIDKTKEDDSYAEFLTTFEYREKPTGIRISVDSNYTLFINGKFVNSGQYPDFPHFKVYDEFDISSYCVEGENKLAVIVWYYGTANMSYYTGNPALRFEVYDDELLAYSDENTLSRKSKAYKSGAKKEITSQLGFSFLYNSVIEDN